MHVTKVECPCDDELACSASGKYQAKGIRRQYSAGTSCVIVVPERACDCLKHKAQQMVL
uniref:Uncharacterized protein n=1 Tax=Physcomitrium patens TaxID=3218 RepID=A0A2K1IMI0_PHYPA|nr:hypothetical protein PHYPA_026792 [Physcomitrium patens]